MILFLFFRYIFSIINMNCILFVIWLFFLFFLFYFCFTFICILINFYHSIIFNLGLRQSSWSCCLCSLCLLNLYHRSMQKTLIKNLIFYFLLFIMLNIVSELSMRLSLLWLVNQLRFIKTSIFLEHKEDFILSHLLLACGPSNNTTT